MSGNTIKPIKIKIDRDWLLRDIARMAAAESVKFFKDSFLIEGFVDTSLVKWGGRNSPLAGKRILYRSGTLMHSIRATEQTAKRVVVSSDTPYSAIHNEGGFIVVTAQMKKWWWAQYSRLSGRVTRTKKGKAAHTKANRKLTAKAEFCKRMALMKVGSKIKIPRRQFMGESQILMHELDGKLQAKIAEHWEKA
jgi:phage gpG-like protein